MSDRDPFQLASIDQFRAAQREMLDGLVAGLGSKANDTNETELFMAIMSAGYRANIDKVELLGLVATAVLRLGRK